MLQVTCMKFEYKGTDLFIFLTDIRSWFVIFCIDTEIKTQKVQRYSHYFVIPSSGWFWPQTSSHKCEWCDPLIHPAVGNPKNSNMT